MTLKLYYDRPASENAITFEQRAINFPEETSIHWDIQYLGVSNKSNATWDSDENFASGLWDTTTNESYILEVSPLSGELTVTYDNISGTNEVETTISVSDIVTNESNSNAVLLYRLTLKNCTINQTYMNIYSYQCSIVYPSELYIRIALDTTVATSDNKNSFDVILVVISIVASGLGIIICHACQCAI